MKRQLLILVGFVLFLMSCKPTKTEKEIISEEHAALLGAWQENDSIDTVLWVFHRNEVKWKGFTHFYRVSSDSLIISGMVHQILDKSENKLKILKLNGKVCTLNRKD